MTQPYKYSGFISYRHSDRQSAIARALQRGLSRYARPFWKIRSIRLFRDETNLSASPDLFGKIIEALDHSHSLLLMASPEAAASHWVEKELTHWLERRKQNGLILVLTDGELVWDETVGRFDRAKTTALPAALLHHFTTQPVFVDIRWSKSPEIDLVDDDPRFADVLATISAALRGVDKDEIAGEHLKTLRVFRASVAAVIAVLVGLACGLALAMLEARNETAIARMQEKRAEDATTQAVAERHRAEDAAGQAVAERNRAEEQRNLARAELARAQRNESLRLAEQSLRETAAGDAVRGIQLAMSALPANYSNPDRPFVPRAEFALAKAISANRLQFVVTPTGDWVNEAAFSPDGSQIAVGTRDGYLKVLDARTGTELRSSMERRLAVLGLAYSPDGKYLATAHQDPPSVQVRDASIGTVLWSEKVKTRPQFLTFTPDSTRLISSARTEDVRPHIWNVRTGELQNILQVVSSGMKSASVDAHSRFFALVTYLNGTFIWDLETGKLLAFNSGKRETRNHAGNAIDFSAFEEGEEQISNARFLPKGTGLILIGKRTLYVLDPQTREIKNHWPFADERRSGADILEVSSNAQWVLISTSPTELAALSLTDGHIISRFSYPSKISEASVSADDRLITAIAEDRVLTAWTLNGDRSFSFPTGHAERVKPPEYSKSGARLMSYGDKTLRVWDARDMRERISPLPPQWRPQALSTDGMLAFVLKERNEPLSDNDSTTERYGIWSVQREAFVRDSDTGKDDGKRTAYFSQSGKWVAIHRLQVKDGGDSTTDTQVADATSNNQKSEKPKYAHSFEIVETENGRTSKIIQISSAESSFEQVLLANDGSKLGLTWSVYGEDEVESESAAEIWHVDTATRHLQMSQAGHSPYLNFTSDLRFAVLTTRTKLKYGQAHISVWAVTTGVKVSEFDRALERPAENLKVLSDHPIMVVGSASTPPQVVNLLNGRSVGDVAGKAIGATQVTRSFDRKRLLVERKDAPATLWNLQTRALIAQMPANSNVMFSDNGRRLLTIRSDGDKLSVEMMDASNGKQLKYIDSVPKGLSLYPGLKGSHVLIQTDLRSFDIHDVDGTAEPRHAILEDRLFRWRMTADDQRLVTADESGRIQFWDVNTGKQIAERSGADRITPLGFARLSLDRIPIIMANGGVEVFNTITGDALWRSPEGTKATSAELTSTGRAIVIREALRLAAFDIETGASIGSASISEGQDAYYNFNDTSDRLFFDLRGGRSALFDVVGRKELGSYENVQLSQLAPSGTALAVGAGNILKLIDARTGDVSREIEFPQIVRKIQFDPAGDQIALVTAEPKLIMVHVKDGAQKAIGSLRHVPTWIQFGATSGELIVYEDSGNLTLRDTETGKILSEFPAEWEPKASPNGWIHQFDPKRTLLAVGTPDNYIRVFRIADGSMITNFNWDDQAIADLGFSLDGRRLLVATEKGALLVWDLSTNRGERVIDLGRAYNRYYKVFQAATDPAFVLAIEPKGRVDLISLNTFESRSFYSGSPESHVGASLSDDGALLAVMGNSGVLRIWHTGTADVLLEKQLTKDSIYDTPEMRFMPNGRMLAVSIGRDPPHIVLLPRTGGTLINAALAETARFGLSGTDMKKPARTARLGIVMRDVTADVATDRELLANEGAIVVEVMHDSAAVAAGLRRGDIITQVDGKVIKNSADVTSSVKEAKQETTLRLIRDREPMILRVMLNE